MTHPILAALRPLAALRTARVEYEGKSAGILYTGRGGATLLEDADVDRAVLALSRRDLEAARTALAPLAAIADRFDANGLDDEARKHWGRDDAHTNTTPPAQIELVRSEGGAGLITLQHALDARAALAG